MFSADDEKYWITAAASAVGSLFHARGGDKAMSLIHRRVNGMTRSPDDKACSAH